MNMPVHDTIPQCPEPNIEAEQSVLGAILLNNETYWELEGYLRVEHFSEGLHQRLYAFMEALMARGVGVNPDTLRHKFSSDEDMKEIGGIAYLAGLLKATVSVRQVRDYAGLVIDRHRRRRLWELSGIINGLSTNEDEPVSDLIAMAEDELSHVVDDSQSQDSVRSFGNAVTEALEGAREAARLDRGLVGVSTGLSGLDDVLGGLRDGNMIVVAGRPGMGKSAEAVRLAVHAARNGGPDMGVGLISLEMQGKELAERALSLTMAEMGVFVPYSKIPRGQVSGGQQVGLEKAADALQSLPLMIEDAGGRKLSDIRALARAMDRAFKADGRRLKLLLIDYLGNIASEKEYRGNAYAETTAKSNGIRLLAQQLKVPVIILSQLSRAVESREDKRPMLSDLRESGAIEQDAHVVVFLYRPEYYLQKKAPKLSDAMARADWEAEMREARNKLTYIVAKNRNGPEGEVTAWCDIKHNWILDEAPSSGQSTFIEDVA